VSPEHRNLSLLEDANRTTDATHAYADLTVKRFEIVFHLRKYDQDVRPKLQQRSFLSQKQWDTFNDLVQTFKEYNADMADFNNAGYRSYLSDQRLRIMDTENTIITESHRRLNALIFNHTYDILLTEQNALRQAGDQLVQDATNYIQGDMQRGIDPNDNLIDQYENLSQRYTTYDEQLAAFEDASLDRHLEINQATNLRVQDDNLARHRESINNGLDEFLKQYYNNLNKRRKTE